MANHKYSRPTIVTYLPKELTRVLLQSGLIVKVEKNCLLLGAPHGGQYDGIKMVVDTPIGYGLVGEMEGFEYLIIDRIRNMTLFNSIDNYNIDFKEPFLEYTPPSNIEVLDVACDVMGLNQSSSLSLMWSFRS